MRVISHSLITLASSNVLLTSPDFPSQQIQHILDLREAAAFQNTEIAVSVGQIHIYERQPGSIHCLQLAVQSSKLNSATQLSLTKCRISERICMFENMTGGPHTHLNENYMLG